MKAKAVGHYLLGKTIGEGTFGRVKLGTHILTDETVAVKILEKARIADVADVERVARELHILKLVQHPHVIQLYEIIETPQQLYLIMEYCNSGELFDFIVSLGRVPEQEACRFFHQIIAGVERLHQLGVVHRDLKPENLLLDTNRDIKIVDFGLSNTFREGEHLQTACGSPCYAAPEMIAGQRYAPDSCDIWSCGVILFALVCGYLPFEDPSTSVLYSQILNAKYELPDFVSDGFCDLVARILNTDPVRRYTVEEIRNHQWYMLIPESSRGIKESDYNAVDEDLLEQLMTLGLPRDYAGKCLKMNKHNHVTTTYHLLAGRKRRLAGRAAQGLLEPQADEVEEVRREQELVDEEEDYDDGCRKAFAVFDGALPQRAAAAVMEGDAEGVSAESDFPVLPPPSPGRPKAELPTGGWAAPPMPSPLFPPPAPPPAPAAVGAPSARARGDYNGAAAALGAPKEQVGGSVSSSAAASTTSPQSPRRNIPAGVALLSAPPRSPSPSPAPTGSGGVPHPQPPVPSGMSSLIAAAAQRRRSPGGGASALPAPPSDRSNAAQVRIAALHSGVSRRAASPRNAPTPVGSTGGSVHAPRRRSPVRPEPPTARKTSPSPPRTAGAGSGQPPRQASVTNGRTRTESPVRTVLQWPGSHVGPGAEHPQGGGGAASATSAARRRSPVGSRAGSPPAAAGGAARASSAAVTASAAAPASARGTRVGTSPGAPVASNSGALSSRVPLTARCASEDAVGSSARGAHWIRSSALQSADAIAQELARSLKTSKVGFKQLSPSLFRCERKGTRFDVHISHLDRSDAPYMVKIQRTAGDLCTYRKLLSRVVSDLQI